MQTEVNWLACAIPGGSSWVGIGLYCFLVSILMVVVGGKELRRVTCLSTMDRLGILGE